MSKECNTPYQYQVGGSLTLESPTYVVRQADGELYQALCSGQYCCVLSGHQTGKSSLRIQTMGRLQTQNIACTTIDLSGISSQQITASQWYGGIIQELISGLNLQVDRRSWLNHHRDRTPIESLSQFIKNVLLTQIDRKIVIFIDPIESILRLNFSTGEFFTLIRHCYESRSQDLEYRRLSFALFGGATSSVLLKDDRYVSCLNLAQAIELQGFRLSEIAPLKKGLEAEVAAPEAVLREVWRWTNGQPLLTQKLCWLIVDKCRNGAISEPAPGDEGQWVEQIVQANIIQNWERQDEPKHLSSIRDHLHYSASSQKYWLEEYRKILQQGYISEQDCLEPLELQLSGLVTQTHSDRTVSNPIYATIFNLEWMSQELTPYIPPSEMTAASVALVFTDIVASTAMMVADEPRALRLVQRDLQRMRQSCQRFEGQVLKSLGDGLLLSFSHVEQAVAFAMTIQKELAIAAATLLSEDVLYHRIGIHFGDVFFRGSDVMGKGVNLAARLQEQAEPGGICLSESAYEQIKHTLPVNVVRLGSRKLKGIPTPVLLYQIPPFHSVFTPIDGSSSSSRYPSGAVPLNSSFYLERTPLETQIREEISRPGALVRIKAPKEMGKTSLMLRVLDYASDQGYHTVSLNLEQVDEAILNDLNRFLRWLCATVTRQLQFETRLNDYWDEDIGSKISCTLYFHNYLLEKIDAPLVLALDEVNYIFEHAAVAREVLPLFRSWYEEAKRSPVWQKLRLIVVHSTEIYVPLQLKQSPFNVGLPIELGGFSLEQVQELAQRYQLDWTDRQTHELMVIVGGHPSLIHLALYHLHRQEITFDQLIATAPTPAGIYSHHLQRHWSTLQEQPALAQALNTVLNSQTPVLLEPIVTYKLSSMGLIRSSSEGVVLSCELYRQYFTGIRDRLE